MKKEKLIEIGLDEAQIEKVLGVINDEMKNLIPKSRFDEVNTEKKNLEVQIKERDEQLEVLKKEENSSFLFNTEEKKEETAKFVSKIKFQYT